MALHKRQPEADLTRCRHAHHLEMTFSSTNRLHRVLLRGEGGADCATAFVFQQVCSQPDQAVPPERRVRSGGPRAGGGVGVLRGGPVHCRGPGASPPSFQGSHLLFPLHTTSPCHIINPLFSLPSLPADPQAPFFINGLSAALQLADASIHHPLPAHWDVNMLYKSSHSLLKRVSERGLKLRRRRAASEAAHISPHSYSAVTRKLWNSLDQSKSSGLKPWKKKMNETLEMEKSLRLFTICFKH